MLTAKTFATGGLGRFANMLFTASGVIGIAVKSGQQYAFPGFKVHDNAIFGNPVDDINEYLLNPLPALASAAGFIDLPYFWGYKEVYLPTGNWSIDSHMQSDKFFNHCLPLIRETFTFKDEFPQKEFVALHYRCGDYIDHVDAQHPRCSAEYYEQAVKQFPIGTNFLVFSDDMKAFQENIIPHFKFDGYKFHLLIGADYITDFKMMKKCKSFITANSSFSLFAAILGDHPEKKIICPKRWFGSQMPPEFDTKDIYPSNAIIL